MTPEDTKYSKVPVILTIVLGTLIVGAVESLGIIAILFVTMACGGFMWTPAPDWAYLVDIIILIATVFLSFRIIIWLYKFLVKSYYRNTNGEIIPKYIYAIAVLLPVVLPIVAYSAYTYSIYHSETEMPETCLVNGLTYLKETDKCKQLDDDSYIEPNPSEPEEPKTNQFEQDQLY